MYIDALINGVTPIPEVPTEIRQHVATMSLPELYAFLEQNDTLMAQKLHKNDKTRLTRAAEIILFTRRKLSEWYQVPMIKKLPEAKFKVIKIVPPIEVIEQRCRERLDKMVEFGVLEEIAALLKREIDESLPAMKALGVPELSLAVKGKLPLSAALELAKLHTRQYAKRQRTWLKNKLDADIEFTEPYAAQSDWLEKIKLL
jgi:tRNA dimethylallyltransferase